MKLTWVYEKIVTYTFHKAIAGNTILHFKSHNPKPMLKSIPAGELTRMKRNCSNQEDYERESNYVCEWLIEVTLRGSSIEPKVFYRINLGTV